MRWEHGGRWSDARRALGVAVLAMLLAPTVAAAGPRTLYVANPTGAMKNTVSAYAIGPSGALGTLGLPSATTGGGPAGTAITPDGRHLYTADTADTSLSGFQIGGDGGLTPLTAPAATTGGYPTGVAITPDGRTLYATSYDDNSISVLRIGADGALSPLNPPSTTTGGAPTGVAITPDGRHLYVANRGDHSVSGFRIAADGALTPLSPPTTPTGDESYGVTITPDGRHLYTADIDTVTGDGVVSGFTIAADGTLSPLSAPSATLDSGAQAAAVAPDGRHLYVATGQGIAGFGIAADGTLTPVSVPLATAPGYPSGGLAVAPDGRHLYSANVSPSGVAGFAIAADGTLATVGGSPFSGISNPNLFSVAIRPDQAPTAALSATVAPVASATRFSAAGSTDADGQVVRYDWDFGDGQRLADGGPSPSHTYGTPGAYAVSVTVTDDEGCSTTFVFTGQTAMCNATGEARAATTITVPAGPAAAAPAPAAKQACASRRVITLKSLRLRRGERIRRAVVFEGSRRIRTVRAGARSLTVNLKGLQKSTFSVRIRTTSRTITRTYRTCTPG